MRMIYDCNCQPHFTQLKDNYFTSTLVISSRIDELFIDSADEAGNNRQDDCLMLAREEHGECFLNKTNRYEITSCFVSSINLRRNI